MSTREYNDLPRLRWTLLKSILQSEQNFLQTVATPVKQSADMAQGSAAHVAILEPEVYASTRVLVPDEFMSDATGKMLANKNVQAWLAAQGEDPLLVTTKQEQMFADMANLITAHEDAGAWMDASPPECREQILQWVEVIPVEGATPRESPFAWARVLDGAVEFDCKATYDLYCPRLNMLVDLKLDGKPGFTTRRTRARIWADGWAGQLGMYARGLLACGVTDEVPAMGFIVASARPGFEDVIAFELDGDAIQEAQAEAEGALVKLATAIAFGNWPGVAPQKVVVSVPEWRTANADDVADLGLDFGGTDDGE